MTKTVDSYRFISGITKRIVHLPFEWPEPPKLVRNHPPQDPPIARYLARNPWFLPRLLSRKVPG